MTGPLGFTKADRIFSFANALLTFPYMDLDVNELVAQRLETFATTHSENDIVLACSGLVDDAQSVRNARNKLLVWMSSHNDYTAAQLLYAVSGIVREDKRHPEFIFMLLEEFCRTKGTASGNINFHLCSLEVKLRGLSDFLKYELRDYIEK